jgi:hypothetical protein
MNKDINKSWVHFRLHISGYQDFPILDELTPYTRYKVHSPNPFQSKTEVEIGYMAQLMKDGHLGSTWVHGWVDEGWVSWFRLGTWLG